MAADESVTFTTPYAARQAAERLRAEVKPTAFHTPFRAAVVGRVSETSVRLRRHRPWFHNGFAPVFYGAFTMRAGATILEGRFGPRRATRAYVAFWYGTLAVMAAVFTVAALSGGPMRETALFVLVLAVLAVLPALLIRLGRWLGRRDVDDISDTIRRALDPPRGA